jgi:hypothetical protein
MDGGGVPLSQQMLHDPQFRARRRNRSLSANGWSKDPAPQVSTVTRSSGGCTSCFVGRILPQVMPSTRPRQPYRSAVRQEGHASDPDLQHVRGCGDSLHPPARSFVPRYSLRGWTATFAAIAYKRQTMFLATTWDLIITVSSAIHG